MSLIETRTVDDLAQSLFDTAVLPLARSRQASGQSGYFPLAPDPAATSYFAPLEPVAAAPPHAVDFPGGGQASGLIDALAAFWTAHGDAELAAMAPPLRTLADAVQAERSQQSGDVDIYCYTMF